MSETIQLKELESEMMDSSCVKQITTMMELLEDNNFFTLDMSPRGYDFKYDGCVGLLSFRNGTKYSLNPNFKLPRSNETSSRILMEMLYSTFGMTGKTNYTENLFEFFVRVFIDTVNKLIVRGLRSKYHLVRGNEKSFKGKIVFNEHIRQNYIHKERIFVEYEEYSQNRPENRLIKTTLTALSRRTTDSRNIKGIKTLLMTLEEIPTSVDVDKDLSKVHIDRNMTDYISSMFWCYLFLKGMGLAGASEDNLSYALLVRTRELYSAYVAKMSSIDRTEGLYQLKFSADVKNEGGAKGTSVIVVDLEWSFYDRKKDISMRDAEALFLSAPGYRVIPSIRGDRLKSMAVSYLSDALA